MAHFLDERPVLGVLGGMGPRATLDFLRRVVQSTPARRDQDHLATVVFSDPATPDRSDAMLGRGPDPYPSLVRGVSFLAAAGCDLIAIPCNTAHFWYDQLSAATGCPIVHIADAVVRSLGEAGTSGSTIGLLATDGTVQGGLYHERFEAQGHRVLDLVDLRMSNPVMLAIGREKAGDRDGARRALLSAIGELSDRGAERIVVACTDLSAAAEDGLPDVGMPITDASQALAAECVQRLLQRA